MRISDWSSDVCSSDLRRAAGPCPPQEEVWSIPRLAPRGMGTIATGPNPGRQKDAGEKSAVSRLTSPTGVPIRRALGTQSGQGYHAHLNPMVLYLDRKSTRLNSSH